ncbi:ABC transporter ATP-binding protein [Gordonibacter sp. Marseille-P4307]|uniref:ABC transporter ATP-binding protein n=1 Tax=Gordonibacter sp. Marseille-P4307 TaxID=2161815 RepID=UPI000F5387E0|nr:ABC transporter ATP-binding protein [Gordonibacter sp. Marseille-P4307]
MNERGEEEKGGRNPVLQLLEFAEDRKGFAVVGSVLSAASGILGVVPYVLVWFVMREFVQVAPRWEEAGAVQGYVWGAFVAVAAGIFVYAAGLLLTHMCAFRIALNMRNRCAEHLSRVPLGYFDSHSSGQLRRVIDMSAAQTEDMIAHKLPDFVGSLVAPLAFIACMFVFDWVMGLMCLVPIFVSAFSMWWMMGRDVPEGGRYFMGKYQAALTRMSESATEYVRGIPVVKVFQQTVRSFTSFYEAIEEYRRMATRYVDFCKIPQVAQLVAINATFAVLVPAGILLAHAATDFPLFLTNFLFYVFFSAFTTSTLTKIMYATETVLVAQDAVNRIEGVLSVEPYTEVSPDKARYPEDASLSLVDVSFSYPGSDVRAIDGVSLEVESGATLALVGESGSGKTTLASLFPRFWDAGEGTVKVGGADVRLIPTPALMDHVAFVFQNDRLFKQTLRDNIRAARPSATDAEVEAAAKAAQCDDIIAKFPDGLDTLVGSKGVHLSGGECQRIAIARAILKDAPIVIFDEATAFADPENEILIQKALGHLCAGKTVLMIAHRLSTVVNADRICVMKAGRIVEMGAHDELVCAQGAYAALWESYRKSVSWKIGGGAVDVA